MELLGKNIIFLGSSVTYGSAAGGVSFADILETQCGVHSVKEAVSGTTLADINEGSYVARLKKLPSTLQPDLLVCQLSTNDAARKLPIAAVEKALREIVEYTKKTFCCPIAFYTNPYYENGHYAAMVALLQELQKEYGFCVLDFYNDPEMRSVSAEDHKRYMADRVHPTLQGYTEWWCPKFIQFLSNI